MSMVMQAPEQGEEWRDWQWQQRNAVRSIEGLLAYFPDMGERELETIASRLDRHRFQVTPYTLSLVQLCEDRRAPRPDDPIWRQLAPTWEEPTESPVAYDSETENWELSHEMVTPIAQKKYDNRVIVRLSNVCHAYCQFCYEALRTIEKKSEKEAFQKSHWAATVDYVRDNPEIEEVILSGGEPLMLSDARLDSVLGDLRAIGRPVNIRLHTRSLTLNPFRMTDNLADIFRKHGVNAMGLHVSHPNEVTNEFAEGVGKLKSAVPILFANIPLLGGVNDDVEVMRRFWMRLYSIGVTPHYLYHFMPFSPGTGEFRTTVETGVNIVSSLKRRISNIAVPEFVLPHESGKYTMPLLPRGVQPPAWVRNQNGEPVVRFNNWQGETVDYPDTAARP